tara:strand:+ start:2975 stop:4045 length:1071 start_codon:yes stop_codon:yes gene_type:complete
MTLNKYLNYDKIKIIDYNDSNSVESNKHLLENYFSLIQKHYLNNKTSKFIPTFEYLKHIIKSNISYIALYTDLQPLYLKNKVIKRENIISGLSSKQIVLSRINDDLPEKMRNLKIHYVDFLCTHTDNRKQNITPKLIYTYAKTIMEFDIKSRDKTNSIFMFKREGEKQSFVPYTVYSNFVFDLKYFHKMYNTNILSKTINIKKVNSSNFLTFARIFQIIKKQMNVLSVDIETIKNYIDNDIIDIYIAFEKNKPLSIYVYKNNCFQYDMKPIYELISSYNIKNIDINVYNDIFIQTIFLLIKDRNIGYITIENLSSNNILINHLRERNREIYKYTNSFYLYNYILNTTKSNSIFMIV